MEPEGSWPGLQEPTSGPYLELDESNLHAPNLFSKDQFQYYTLYLSS
jgi:hypothetical protein